MNKLSGVVSHTAAKAAFNPAPNGGETSQLATASRASVSDNNSARESRSPSSGKDRKIDAQFEKQKTEERNGFKTGNRLNVAA